MSGSWLTTTVGFLVFVLAALLALGLWRVRGWRRRLRRARQLLELGQLEEADHLAGAVVDELERLLGPEDPQLLDALHARGRTRQAVGRYEDAEALYKRALELHQRAPRSPPARGPRLLQLLSTCLRDQGRLIEAEGVATQALEAAERFLEADDPRIGDLHFTVGACHQATGRLDLAEVHLQMAEEILAASGPPGDRRLGAVREALARLTDARVPGALGHGPGDSGERPISLN